jgi:hypothetical protein
MSCSRVSSPQDPVTVPVPLNKKQKGGRPGPLTRNNKPLCAARACHKPMDTNSVLALIGPLSPSLAAYHHVKFQGQVTVQSQLSRCSRCGHFLLPGSSTTRVARVARSSKREYKGKGRSDPSVLCMRQTCATCGHVNNTFLHPTMHHPSYHSDDFTTPSPPPKTVATPRTLRTDQHDPLPDPGPVPSSHLHSPPQLLPSPSPLTNSQTQRQTKSKKSRPKHKAGLQEMLARNKDRQREAANRDPLGLATFLHSL